MPLEHHEENFSYKDIALMPLRGTILFTTLGLSIFLYMAKLAGPLFGGWLFIISIVAMVRYAQVIVSKTMSGYTEPPALSPYDFNIAQNMGAVGFFCVLVLLSLAGWFIGDYLGAVARGMFSLAAIVALPAMLAASVTHNSFSSAIDPVLISRTVTALSPRYFGVVALVTAGYLGSSALADAIGWPFISILAGVYGLFLVSCGVGRLLFASRTELELNVETRQELMARENRKHDYRYDSDALKVAAQTARLTPIQAAEGLWDYHQRSATSLERQWESFDALKKWDNPNTALRFAQPFAASLVTRSLKEQALDVVRWCFRTEPEFRLADAPTTFTLGHYALSLGQHQLAANILQDVGRRYPENPNTVASLITVGKLQAEKLNQPERVKDAVLQLRALGISATDPRVQALTRYLSERSSA